MMRALVLVAIIGLGVGANGSAAAVKPLTRATVVAALEAKLKTSETARAAKLAGHPVVACSVVSASSRAPAVVQCWASVGGKIRDAVSANVGCGVKGEPPCGRPSACLYSVSVLAPPPKVISTYSVNACSSKS